MKGCVYSRYDTVIPAGDTATIDIYMEDFLYDTTLMSIPSSFTIILTADYFTRKAVMRNVSDIDVLIRRHQCVGYQHIDEIGDQLVPLCLDMIHLSGDLYALHLKDSHKIGLRIYAVFIADGPQPQIIDNDAVLYIPEANQAPRYTLECFGMRNGRSRLSMINRCKTITGASLRIPILCDVSAIQPGKSVSAYSTHRVPAKWVFHGNNQRQTGESGHISINLEYCAKDDLYTATNVSDTHLSFDNERNNILGYYMPHNLDLLLSLYR